MLYLGMWLQITRHKQIDVCVRVHVQTCVKREDDTANEAKLNTC